MKKFKTINIFLIIVLILSIISPTFVFAVTDYSKDSGIDFERYRGTGEESPVLKDKAEAIVGIIKVVGIVVSVIALILIGIKYMMGSVEEKAEYKKTMIPYIIGALLVFTVSLIPNLIYVFMQNINK